jgi:TatA/E family protein of Tat protein translocase
LINKTKAQINSFPLRRYEMPFGLQPWHLIVIALVALLIFGPSRLPEIGRGIGKSITEFRKGAREMGESFHEEVSQAATTSIPQTIQPVYNPPPQFAPPAQYPQGVEQPLQVIDAGTFQTSPSQPIIASGHYCVHCGASNPAAAKFCNNCGQLVNAVK